MRGLALVGHELTHVLQYRHLGGRRFLDGYLQNYASNRRSGQSHDDAYRNIVLEDIAFKVGSVIRNFLAKNPEIASKIRSGEPFTGAEISLISSALQEAVEDLGIVREGFQVIQGVLVRVEYPKE